MIITDDISIAFIEKAKRISIQLIEDLPYVHQHKPVGNLFAFLFRFI